MTVTVIIPVIRRPGDVAVTVITVTDGPTVLIDRDFNLRWITLATDGHGPAVTLTASAHWQAQAAVRTEEELSPAVRPSDPGPGPASAARAYCLSSKHRPGLRTQGGPDLTQ